MNRVGKLEIITGPMFAGKTTELLRRLVVLNKAGMNVLYMNHSGDTRITEYMFSTHAKTIVVGSDALPSITISELPCPSKLTCRDLDVIGFDEGHWYPDLHVVNECVRMGLHVILCGLHATENRELLGKLPTLFPNADDVTFLKAYCSVCYTHGLKVDASFTWRYNPNPYTFVGGSEQYKAVCRQHHPGGNPLNVIKNLDGV